MPAKFFQKIRNLFRTPEERACIAWEKIQKEIDNRVSNLIAAGTSHDIFKVHFELSLSAIYFFINEEPAGDILLVKFFETPTRKADREIFMEEIQKRFSLTYEKCSGGNVCYITK